MSQTSELGGGIGFTFEDNVAAFFLAGLLNEGFVYGNEQHVIHRVAIQQRAFGDPLDDIIIDGKTPLGSVSRLSLQVKRSLAISSALTNVDFHEVIRDSWRTYKKEGFRESIDRFGVVADEIAMKKARAIITLCEHARASQTLNHFLDRLENNGGASSEEKFAYEAIVELLLKITGGSLEKSDVHQFLAHFVLIKFDFLHAGAIDTARIVTSLRDSLSLNHATQALQLWDTLRRMARDASGRAGEFNRPQLVSILSKTYCLRAAPSLRGDLEKLTTLAKFWVSDIQNDIGGAKVERRNISIELESVIAKSRVVKIIGAPGSGKSALLRQEIESSLLRGSVLFIKYDRLTDSGWPAFAITNGLSAASLSDVLIEIGSTGSKCLYVDGIDRIEKKHQGVVLDIIREIVQSSILDEWKIVVTLRESSAQRSGSWFSEAFKDLENGIVKVNLLDDGESAILANLKPSLRPLLFGSEQVREIVRRPFFARILDQTSARTNAESALIPQSELDLLHDWWVRGGYDSEGRLVFERQRSLIELAEANARQLDEPIRLNKLTVLTISLIDDFVVDGILRAVTPGHTVRFTHDIFFEWSFFHVLIDRDRKWLEAIVELGEPPAVGRVVELLSQREYDEGNFWNTEIPKLTSKNIRSQWLRAWLLGPLTSTTFEKNAAEYETLMLNREFDYLKFVLVWFQSVKTAPNARILSGELPIEIRHRIADLLSWPSDILAWRRLINFVLNRIELIQVSLLKEVVGIFEVWQNAFFDYTNSTSEKMLAQIANWLSEIESMTFAEFADNEIPASIQHWKAIANLDDFVSSLRKLVLQSSRIMPQLTTDYISRVIEQGEISEATYKKIITFSTNLASTHPDLLVELTFLYQKNELLEDRLRREKKEQDERRKRRNEQKEKSHQDEIIGKMAMMADLPMFSKPISYWSDTFALEDDFQNFYPPSPLREPFHSLFKTSPVHGIRLLNGLCNHAIAEWRQLSKNAYDSPGTPIPVQIDFSWGRQHFWGTNREYLWYRGLWAPKAIACGFMSLEKWCFEELERGRLADELIQFVVEGNESVAILGVVSTIALEAQQLSEVIFHIATCQRLWEMDRNRLLQESMASSNFFGFDSESDLQHLKSVKEAASRPVRRLELRWLASHFVLSKAYSERARAAIMAFKEDLPFEWEEHRHDELIQRHLFNQAKQFAEIASLDNYLSRQTDQPGIVEVTHVSPREESDDSRARIKRAQMHIQEGSYWAAATSAFESGKINQEFDLSAAIKYVSNFDSDRLFGSKNDSDQTDMRRSAVASVAALTLVFREGNSDNDLRWARNVLIKAANCTTEGDTSHFGAAVVPWHFGLFAARGLAADLRAGNTDQNSSLALLNLVSHRLEAVVIVALEQIASLWDFDKALVSAAFQLALSLCRFDSKSDRVTFEKHGYIHTDQHIKEEVRVAVKRYGKRESSFELPLPPPAWIKLKENDTSTESVYEDGTVDDAGDFHSSNWVEPPMLWHSKHAAKIVSALPYKQILDGQHRIQLLNFFTAAIQWTIEKDMPPWKNRKRRNRGESGLYEWRFHVASTLGRFTRSLSLVELERFLEPIFALDDELCYQFLRPFVTYYVCEAVYDADKVSAESIDVLNMCLGRFLRSSSLSLPFNQTGKLYGFDEPKLAECLMFVSIEKAALAKRYVNGDWSEIHIILPLINRFITSAGWSNTVMDHYLTLCERSRSAYPAALFATQILIVIETSPSSTFASWNGAQISARVADLVEHFAQQEPSVAHDLGQKLLRILDFLIDLGDRRSAALQLTESFREIRSNNDFG